MNEILAGVFDFGMDGLNPLFVICSLGNSELFRPFLCLLYGEFIALAAGC